ncbi:hypothetical protein HYH02_012410 [Chlamydomonas schloesseri]|uniref:Uncharacterized protein n=1 Tax=Chlamydomonas schloesseri TaxID=2026947 RepID=A0A835W225_9CHLO|nr:hypothetical protein HYH02_012410 [Chlamydomonas schloesseri]|eukprot:KAG2434398.1 hypothetical protein HYH02_012410 [Chlamydomonas schloesseri]
MDKLLFELLSEEQFEAAAEHWKVEETGAAGNAAVIPADAAALRDVLRAARAFAVSSHSTSTSSQPRHPTNLGPTGVTTNLATVSDFLSAAEKLADSLPTAGHDTHAFARRTLTAALLVTWRAVGCTWNQEDDATALRILKQLYNLHAAGAGGKAAVEFYHFSKAAGTSVCRASAVVGCTTYSVKDQYTCLIPEFGDGPRWMDRKEHERQCERALPDMEECPKKINSKMAKWGARYSAKDVRNRCSKRAQLLNESSWSFYASEYTLRGRGGRVDAPPAVCREFLNLAVLRSPRERLLSHMRYLVALMSSWLGPAAAGSYFAPMTSAAQWRALLPAALDNMYARALLGESAFYAPQGGLSAEQHLTPARAVLAAGMDVVLVLEDPEPLSVLGHRWGLGWQHTLLDEEGRSSEDASGRVRAVMEQAVGVLAGSEVEALVAANALDQQLYDWARLLTRLDGLVWAAAAAEAEGAAGSSSGSSGGGAGGGRTAKGPNTASAAGSGGAEAGAATASDGGLSLGSSAASESAAAGAEGGDVAEFRHQQHRKLQGRARSNGGKRRQDAEAAVAGGQQTAVAGQCGYVGAAPKTH